MVNLVRVSCIQFFFQTLFPALDHWRACVTSFPVPTARSASPQIGPPPVVKRTERLPSLEIQQKMTMALGAEVDARFTRPRTEISEEESLQLIRNLVRIAMFNISYIRGLFPEIFYQEKFVPGLEMKVKKLLPMDLESKRYIDWMEKGVFDALQKKYLRTLLLKICSGHDGPLVEEYMFSFKYAAQGSLEENSSMTIERSSGKHVHTHTNNRTNPQQMKQSACKMVRTLVQLMLALDNVPKERTIIMTLHYYDDITPADYEPPFFASCTFEDPNLWAREPLKIKVGSVNSKHHKLAIKVKSVFDPSRDECNLAKNETCSGDTLASRDDDSSTSSEAIEVDAQQSQPCSQPSEPSQPSQQLPGSKEQLQATFEGISLENGFKRIQATAEDSYDSDTDKTEDNEFEAESLQNVRKYLLTRKDNTVHMADIFNEFPQISKVLMEELVERLVEDEVLIILKKDLFQIRKTQIGRLKGTESNGAQQHCGLQTKSLQATNAEENKISKAPKGFINHLEADAFQQRLYEMALFHTLKYEQITMKCLKAALVSDEMVRRLFHQMSQDGYIEESPSGKGPTRGRKVLHTPEAEKKLQELHSVFGCMIQKDKAEQWGILFRVRDQSKTLDESGRDRMLVLGSDATQQGQPIQPDNSSDNDRHTKGVPNFKEPPLPQQAMQERPKAEQSGHTHVAPTTLMGMGKRIRVQDSDPPLDINIVSQSKMVEKMVKASKVKGPIYQPPFKRVRQI